MTYHVCEPPQRAPGPHIDVPRGSRVKEEGLRGVEREASVEGESEVGVGEILLHGTGLRAARRVAHVGEAELVGGHSGVQGDANDVPHACKRDEKRMKKG